MAVTREKLVPVFLHGITEEDNEHRDRKKPAGNEEVCTIQSILEWFRLRPEDTRIEQEYRRFGH